MIYAGMMLITLLALIAFWRGNAAGVPLFLIATLGLAVAFAVDITDPLMISL